MRLGVKIVFVAILGLLAACSSAPNLSNDVPGVPSGSPTGGFSRSKASANKNTLVGYVDRIGAGLARKVAPGNIGLSSASPTEVAAALVEKDYPTVAKHLRQLRLEAGSIHVQGTVSCSEGGTITSTDESEDRDGDGIPVYAEIRFNNCREGGITFNGLLRAQDKDDSDPEGGFTIVVDFTQTDGTDTSRVALGIDYTPGAGGAYSVRYGYLFEENSDRVAFGVNMTYTPRADGNSDPYDAGSVNFQGRLAYEVDSDNYVLDMRGEGLEHRSSCDSSFVSGRATFQDNESNRLVIQYSGCGSYTVTYNGEVI
jgi:hypothetical protein